MIRALLIALSLLLAVPAFARKGQGTAAPTPARPAVSSISMPLGKNQIRLPTVRERRGDGSLLVKTSVVDLKSGVLTTSWGRQVRGKDGRFQAGFVQTGKTSVKTDPRSWAAYLKQSR